MFKEFKEFAIKGNVIDMAVGMMIGAAFHAVVMSLVQDVLTPPLGAIVGGLHFSEKFVVLRPGTTPGPYATLVHAMDSGATVIAYGKFINAVVSFVMVSMVLFFVVRWMNALRRPDTPPAPNTKACPFCKSSLDVTATRCAYCTSQLDVEAAGVSV